MSKRELTPKNPWPDEEDIPPSREVRLEDGVTHGVYEHLILQAHTGGTGDLLHSMAGAELTDELRRSRAIREYKDMLHAQLSVNGYLTVADLDRLEADWHAQELFGENQNF